MTLSLLTVLLSSTLVGSNNNETETRTHAPRIVSLEVYPERVHLKNAFDYRQLLITARLENGDPLDVTRLAQRGEDSHLVHVDERGLVSPKASGVGELAFAVEGLTLRVPIEVGDLGADHDASFTQDVMPVLSRAGCNAGTCHGSQNGKNGFKLSLRGYDPLSDHDALTSELSGRRFNPVRPERSLFLQKPLARVAHEGGRVFSEDSRAYKLLLAWIENGAKVDERDRPTRLEVLPANASIGTPGSEQQIAVLAHYADGLVRDVTREAFVESSDNEVVRADGRGLVTAVRRGEAAILARYEGTYAASPIFVMGDRAGWTWQQQPVHNYVDELVDKKLRNIRSEASQLCTDEEFLRRIHLDLTGLPPSSKAVRTFLLDHRETRIKREEEIERLIGSPEFIDHWTNKWADLLQVNAKFLGTEGASRFHQWIRTQVASNTPYDQFAQAILAARGSTFENPAAAYYKILRKPDLVMENTTQLFMGVRFNCNKCHDHPFERWTRAQHWKLASFFAQVGRSNAPGAALMPLVGDNRPEEALAYEEVIADLASGDAADSETGIVYPAEFPFEHATSIPEEGTRRDRFVAWLTAATNPYFTTSYVNRVWSYFLGLGLIEPVDDLRAGNPPTNPELLERLTADFVESGFDVRHLMRTICRSRTYQLSIEPTEWNSDDQLSFSHARARRLSAEVLYDALCRATGSSSQLPGMLAGERAAAAIDPSTRLEDGFLDLFGRPPRESACECERSSGMSLGQALHLVNGPTVADAVRDPHNRLSNLASVESRSEKIIDELYLSFLGRFPTMQEQGALQQGFDLENPENSAALDPQERERWETEMRAMEAQHRSAQWHPLEWVDMRSAAGADLSLSAEGSLQVGSGAADKDTLTLVLWTDLVTVRGLRLDVLPDSALPSGGPGLADNGNFVLHELRATAIPFDDPSAARVIAFTQATADFAQEGFPAPHVLDGKLDTGWAVMPAFGQKHSLVLELAEDIGSQAGTTLVITLDQQFGQKHLIGRLRFSATESERPIRHSGLPDLVERAIAKPQKQRTEAESRALWKHFVSTRPELVRALRLGATQDLAWALANSPAFLFNR